MPDEKKSCNRLYFDVLNAQLKAHHGGEYHTMDRLFDLKNKCHDSDKLLVDLLDYYLGAGAGEVLQEFITEKGGEIVPLLIKKREKPLNCVAPYQSICTKNKKHRNQRIDEMVEAINQGIVLKSAE